MIARHITLTKVLFIFSFSHDCSFPSSFLAFFLFFCARFLLLLTDCLTRFIVITIISPLCTTPHRCIGLDSSYSFCICFLSAPASIHNDLFLFVSLICTLCRYVLRQLTNSMVRSKVNRCVLCGFRVWLACLTIVRISWAGALAMFSFTNKINSKLVRRNASCYSRRYFLVVM